jgi:PKD repeat protein
MPTQPVTFDASPSIAIPPIECAWDFGDGVTDTGITASHTYDQPGDYNATLTVNDALGRTSSITKFVTAQEAAATPYLRLVNDPGNSSLVYIERILASPVTEIYAEINMSLQGIDLLPDDDTHGDILNFRHGSDIVVSDLRLSDADSDRDGIADPTRPWLYGITSRVYDTFDPNTAQGGNIIQDTHYTMQMHSVYNGLVDGWHNWTVELRENGSSVGTLTGSIFEFAVDYSAIDRVRIQPHAWADTAELRVYYLKLGTTDWGSSDLFNVNYADSTTAGVPGPFSSYSTGFGGTIEVVAP